MPKNVSSFKELEEYVQSFGIDETEAIHIADKLDQLPAGSGAIEAILVISLIVFLVLLITDIAGYTDVFPFVK